MNVPFVLQQHLCHIANEEVVALLVSQYQEMLGPSGIRLLKLLSTSLFDSTIYQSKS